MNNVLIAVDTSESSFWLAYYGIGLAHRISANVSILMVVDDEYVEQSKEADEWIGLPEKRLESLLAEEHSDTSHINYYVTHGKYETEIPEFIKENNITALFVSQPQAKNQRQSSKFVKMLDAVSRNTSCHIEVVQKVSGHAAR